jgi:hypothetical protein
VLSNGVVPKNKDIPPSMTEALAAGQTHNENMMAAAIDWAEKMKTTKEWDHLDLTKIAAGGQSCGGLEAWAELPKTSRFWLTDRLIKTHYGFRQAHNNDWCLQPRAAFGQE